MQVAECVCAVPGFEGRDPVDDIRKINEELELYSPELASRPRIIAANKIDMMSDETKERLEEFAKEQGCEIIFIAAAIAHGTDELCEIAKLIG